MGNSEYFKHVFTEFSNKEILTEEDYKNMFVAVYRVTTQGTGIGFDKIFNIIEDVLQEKKNKIILC